MTTRRPATAQEIIEDKAFYVSNSMRISYRHGIKELYAPRSKNGVAHREFSKALLRIIDGVPHVNHGRKLTPITGDVVTFENGKSYISDLRLVGFE